MKLKDYLARTIATCTLLSAASGGCEKKNENLEKKAAEPAPIVNQVSASNHLAHAISAQREEKKMYSAQDEKLLTNVLYGEAANQSSRARRVIGRVIMNRVRSIDYPSTLEGVIFERNAFSCINDRTNKNWKQATGESARNGYEERVYRGCNEDAEAILSGERLGIPDENEIIAYHDKSISYADLVEKEMTIKSKWEKKGKTYKGYWMNLTPVCEVDRFIVYKKK